MNYKEITDKKHYDYRIYEYGTIIIYDKEYKNSFHHISRFELEEYAEIIKLALKIKKRFEKKVNPRRK